MMKRFFAASQAPLLAAKAPQLATVCLRVRLIGRDRHFQNPFYIKSLKRPSRIPHPRAEPRHEHKPRPATCHRARRLLLRPYPNGFQMFPLMLPTPRPRAGRCNPQKPEASCLPSGGKATAQIQCEWPSSVPRNTLVAESESRSLP